MIGCKNLYLDKCPRNQEAWSDTNPNYSEKRNNGKLLKLGQMICGDETCCGTKFEVFQIECDYVTLARCVKCGRYHIAHSG